MLQIDCFLVHRLCKFESLPASPVTVALYHVSIAQQEDTSSSKSKKNNIFYAMNWVHNINAVVLNPCSDQSLKLCLEGCRMKVAKSLVKKEPMTPEIMRSFVCKFASEIFSLADLRLITLFVVSFAVFF